ncbi:CUS1 [Mytilus edulis]|uniref:SF3B2 n=1 Tax=Mytilus edulis TaxID=6550 RepID=A0A8S3SBG0_MYTED|nr:CUS1 [Mytilus edulis]
MTIHGDLYYEGKEFETRLKEKKPGNLSDELRTALGMPIGHGCSFGYHAGGWGHWNEMSFQPEKKKSLSDRFGCIPSVGHGQQNDSQNFSKSWKGSGQKNSSFTSSYSRNEKKDPKNTLTVCLKVNRQNKDNSYVNRPCQPLRMECRDKPSEIAKQFSRNGSQDSKENNSVNFNHGYGRQVAVKDTCVNGELRNSQDELLSMRWLSRIKPYH